MSKTTYKNYGLDVRVYLDGKHVGTIKRTDGGWSYWPKGCKVCGETSHSLQTIKRSLENA